ncbi:MAG: hypothetical protein U0V87_03795 [Acidobacteriota bacterium]
MRRYLGSLLVAGMLASGAARSQTVPVLESVNPAAGPPNAEVTLAIRGQNLAPGLKAALLPGGPVMAGRADLLVDCYDVARDGDLALVAFFEHVDKFGGFRVLDVADPRAPQVIGSFDTVDRGQALAIRGTTAFIATLNPYTYVIALRSVDLSDPAHPRELAVLYHPTGYPQSMTIAGPMAYIAAGSEGVLIVDISDPSMPLLRGQIPTQDFSYGVIVRDQLAYVADGAAGLQVYDVSVPESPTRYGSGAPTAGLAYDVVVSGGVALVSDPIGGLFAFDLSNINAPALTSQITTPGSPSGIWLEGKRLFVADGPAGLTILDVANPASPRMIGNTVPPSGAQTTAVQVVGGYAYLSDFFQGLAVFDVRRSAAPNTLAASLPLPSEARDAVLSGNTLYVAAGEAGLLTFDASNPRALIPLGALDTDGNAEAVVVAGTRAFVADGLNGLLIVDVENPSAPVVLGGFDTTGNALALAVEGDVAYVADDARGLRLIDISNPAAPVQLGFYDTPGRSFGVAVQGNVAYVADYLRGLQLIDVSNPRRPTLLSNIDTQGRSVGVAVSGTELFVADDFNGVVILDVANPRAPQVIGQAMLPGNALGLRLDGDTLSVAAGVAGLALIDVTDRAHPFVFGSYDTPGSVRAIAGGAPDVIVADGVSGIATLRLNPRLATVFFNSSTQVSTVAPAGFATGPYHLTIAGADGSATLENAYTVCEPRRVAVTLTPVLNDGPDRFRLPLPWQVSLSALDPQRTPYRAVRAILPTLPAAVETTPIADSGELMIELVISNGKATARLRGSELGGALGDVGEDSAGWCDRGCRSDQPRYPEAQILIGFLSPKARQPRLPATKPSTLGVTHRLWPVHLQRRSTESHRAWRAMRPMHCLEGFVDDDLGCAVRRVKPRCGLRSRALASSGRKLTRRWPLIAPAGPKHQA